MSTARFNTLQNAAGSKSVPVDTVVDGSAKAWVNFNGTGTVAIRTSFNVSSITDNGTGDYTINFTSAFADANYAASYASGDASGQGRFAFGFVSAPTTTAFRVISATFGGASTDMSYVCVSIFR